jgi:hypothetical protein
MGARRCTVKEYGFEIMVVAMTAVLIVILAFLVSILF